jgi:xanthine phosphoribosyltransferase
VKQLCDRIASEGRVLSPSVLKVDSFLNHQIDVSLIEAMGEEFYRIYGDCGVTKVLTIESSGISVACAAGRSFGVPVLFAKKSRSSNIPGEVWSEPVHSFTHGNDYLATVSRRFLSPEDRILIIDDFLASGQALKALIDICRQAKAEVVGCGIAVEKVHQSGGELIRSMGIRVESLARIVRMDDDGIEFAE